MCGLTLFQHPMRMYCFLAVVAALPFILLVVLVVLIVKFSKRKIKIGWSELRSGYLLWCCSARPLFSLQLELKEHGIEATTSRA